MTDLVQLNLSVGPDLSKVVDELAIDYEWTKRRVITTAVEALAELMERLDRVAASAPEVDVAALFRRVAHRMPGPLVGAEVGWGRLEDGRPALIYDGWWIADDGNGDLMAVRQDGSRVGRIAHGRIEPLAERGLEIETIGSLT